jgi:hypothetical protein
MSTTTKNFTTKAVKTGTAHYSKASKTECHVVKILRSLNNSKQLNGHFLCLLIHGNKNYSLKLKVQQYIKSVCSLHMENKNPGANPTIASYIQRQR